MSKQRGPGWLFHLAAGATAVFVLTVLAMVATMFGDPAAPLNVWLNRHGGQLLTTEVVLIVISAVCAMARDQWRSARDRVSSRE